jgi:hypothetical protein
VLQTTAGKMIFGKTIEPPASTTTTTTANDAARKRTI